MLKKRLASAGFRPLQISKCILPIGNWSEGGDEFLGLMALESFLIYIDSSILLLQQNSGLGEEELVKFTAEAKQALETLGEAKVDFLEVEWYVSP